MKLLGVDFFDKNDEWLPAALTLCRQ